MGVLGCSSLSGSVVAALLRIGTVRAWSPLVAVPLLAWALVALVLVLLLLRLRIREDLSVATPAPFAPPPESPELGIAADLWREIDELALAAGRSVDEVVREAVRRHREELATAGLLDER